MAAVDNDTLVRDFVEAFNTKDADRLAPFLHEDIVFSNYGDVVIAEQDSRPRPALRLTRLG